MTPEHKQHIEHRLRNYWEVQARYRYLTQQEYALIQGAEQELPTDSMKSGTYDGMPHGTGVGEPTLRVVLSREAIRERALALAEEWNEELDGLRDELVAFAELWASLSPVERALIDALYWRGLSHETAADWLIRQARGPLDGYRIPASPAAVYRERQTLLEKIARVWRIGMD